MPVAVFDVEVFKLRYPEFDCLADPLLNSYFDEAGIYLSNTEASPIPDVRRRVLLLNMLVAHIAALNQPGSTSLVGRISGATEGSVSVSVESASASEMAAWFMQTKYGAAYWQATSSFRTFRYLPGFSRAPARVGRGFPWRR